MRSTVSTTLLFIVFMTNAFLTYGQINLGAYIGLNSSSFVGDRPQYVAYGFDAGYVIGLTADFKLTEDVFLEVSPAYALGRLKILETDSLDVENIYEYPVRNRSVQLPIFVKIYAKPKLHFDTGLVPVYLFSSEAEIRGEEIDLTQEIAKGYLGVLFGLGYQLELGKSSIGFNLHYIQGLNTITNEKFTDSYVPRVRITNVRLTAVYQFKVKGYEE